MKVPANRKGFVIKKIEAPLLKDEVPVLKHSSCVVYYESKLTHSGVSSWKTFEGFNRKMSHNSLSNLLNSMQADMDGNVTPKKTVEVRKLNATQSRKVKNIANKLCYYSRVRTFVSRKTGSYKFKVGFLTLTAPDGATDVQLINAFEHFLDYLRRTANCVYLWKKELGEENKHLHFHLMINNFIPHYLVSWKWKRLLIAEGVKWQINNEGKDTDSHTRIELPKSRKLVAHYIGKYMSKAYSLDKSLGYISGHSVVLDNLKENRFIEGDLPSEELNVLSENYRTMRDLFLTHICVDLRTVQKLAPTVYFWFDRQFKEFQDQITLPQKYWYV